MKKLSYFLLGILVVSPMIAYGQDADLWVLVGNALKPFSDAWTLVVPGGISGSAIHANNELTSSDTLTVDGDSVFHGTVKITGLNCAGRSNGGVVTAESDGTLVCGDDNTITGFSDTFEKIADPAISPGSDSNATSFSADSEYLSVVSDFSPYLTIYKRSGNIFTKLPDPAVLPPGSAIGTVFSSDGVYLTVAHAGFPYLTIYKRSGDTFTKLPNPTALPPDKAINTAFSPDGAYLAVTHRGSPYLTIYKRSGDTFTKLPNPTALPTGLGLGASFSPNGAYLTVGHINFPFITIYKRSGDTFTKLTDPALLPPDQGNGTVFSPDGIYLAVAHPTSPFITIYKRSGDTFTKLPNPAMLPANTTLSPSFSPDGTYLAVSQLVSPPFFIVYKRSGDTFTKLPNPASLPTGHGISTRFSPDGTFLAVSHDVSPYLTIYKAQEQLTPPSVVPGRVTLWHDESKVIAGGALSVNFDTLQRYSTYSYQSPASVSDAFTNGFMLRPGVYTFSVLGLTNNAKAMIDWYIDDFKVIAQQDWYSAAGTYNVTKTATVSIAGNGTHVLRGQVNGKNANSTAYNLLFTKMWFTPAVDTQ